MAKSTRSKVKRSYRAKKREEGVYAAVEAARLERLSSKLRVVRDADKDGDVELADGEEGQAESTVPEVTTRPGPSNPDSMELDGASPNVNKKVSTHGRGKSRREEWRTAKGMKPPPKSRSMNRQGGIAAKRKPGRPHRRR
ncbi:hypothetical protein DFH11DRAFT_1601923 [Phellopilus nigrolimitatus]|nr:hypothetical protein DFH11DRAFT_1601923 [Phellopilus nigrolimitatus]